MEHSDLKSHLPETGVVTSEELVASEGLRVERYCSSGPSCLDPYRCEGRSLAVQSQCMVGSVRKQILRIVWLWFVVLVGVMPVRGAVKATVYTEKGFKDLDLLAVSDGKLRYSFAGGGAASVLSFSDIKRVRIEAKYDRSALRKAIGQGQHGAAAAMLVKPLLPTLPFLELPGCNVTPVAMDAVALLMRAAEERLLVGDDKARTEAMRQYKVALAFAEAVSRADWYEAAEEADCRAVACLVALDQVDKAKERLTDLAIPAETDPAFGWHALARARVLTSEGQWEAALEAAVESLAFETKDIDSFPGAMVISATCYEKLDEWHRARDVYYALGRLFRDTTWEVYAIGRLRRILEQGLTDEEEKQLVHQVFFSGREDLNGQAQSLIEAYLQRKKKGQEDK